MMGAVATGKTLEDSRPMLRLAGSMKHGAILAPFLCIAAASACATHHPTDTVGEAVKQAADSMRSGDAETLHGMLGERLVIGMSVDSLAATMKDDAKELAALAKDMENPASITMEATVETGSGKTLEFVLEGETWKLLTHVVEPEVATDPLSALALLAKGLLEIREDLMASGVLAAQHETGILHALETIAGEISSVKSEALILNDDRCYVTLATGQKIELVREGESWKVMSMFPPLQFP